MPTKKTRAIKVRVFLWDFLLFRLCLWTCFVFCQPVPASCPRKLPLSLQAVFRELCADWHLLKVGICQLTPHINISKVDHAKGFR